MTLRLVLSQQPLHYRKQITSLQIFRINSEMQTLLDNQVEVEDLVIVCHKFNRIPIVFKLLILIHRLFQHNNRIGPNRCLFLQAFKIQYRISDKFRQHKICQILCSSTKINLIFRADCLHLYKHQCLYSNAKIQLIEHQCQVNQFKLCTTLNLTQLTMPTHIFSFSKIHKPYIHQQWVKIEQVKGGPQILVIDLGFNHRQLQVIHQLSALIVSKLQMFQWDLHSLKSSS